MQTNTTAEKIETLLQTYGNGLFRLSLVMLRNESDAEDAIQDTMIRYLQKAPNFRDADHEKAWLFKVCTNICHDMLRYRKRHPQVDIDTQYHLTEKETDASLLDALMELPERFKLVLILYYVEGYRIHEIAEIIERSPSAVKMRLQKGRKLLENTYRKEYL
ncbi:MAG: RNA polymerase sigma factor [Anaerotignum sp.]|nr:RNA polymerase sigma factor [Anaerotignum sp.]MBQ7084246.1 RNA polymerase sigma factor [Anaerotignum sp.]